MHKPTLTTAPADTAISLADVKVRLRVDSTDDDALILGLIAAATRHLDGWSGILGRCIVTQTWSINFDVCTKVLRLPLAPVTGVPIVTVTDSADASQVIAPTNYRLLEDAKSPFLRFVDAYALPSDLAEVGGINVEFVAGFGAATDVPDDIKQALHLIVGHWYLNREAATAEMQRDIPFGAMALLSTYRRVWM
jgi:uncharacterized phiE125 gp8 family phage protein